MFQVRREAGAGDPPGRITNNDSEIANRMAKQFQNFKKLPVQDGLPKMQQFVEHQVDIRKRATFNLDPTAVRMKGGSDLQKSKYEYDISKKNAVLKHFQNLFPSLTNVDFGG